MHAQNVLVLALAGMAAALPSPAEPLPGVAPPHSTDGKPHHPEDGVYQVTNNNGPVRIDHNKDNKLENKVDVDYERIDHNNKVDQNRVDHNKDSTIDFDRNDHNRIDHNKVQNNGIIGDHNKLENEGIIGNDNKVIGNKIIEDKGHHDHHWHHKNETIVTTTKVVSVYTTYCPEPTTFTFNKKEYIVTKPTTITITDCPCTIVEVRGYSTGFESYCFF
jgi:hypothetical protein